MKFGLIGAAGFVAPRHMRAIKETGHELIATYDVHDSVGILDSYFPGAEFFTSRTDFMEYFNGHKADYISIATPSVNHQSDILWSLLIGANVICEKPLVLNSKDLFWIARGEKKSGKSVSTILQLRLHPAIVGLRGIQGFHQVNLDYVTPRGRWYFSSWKADIAKSGGLLMNIGVHIFDMLLWLFGPCREIVDIKQDNERAIGILTLENASVNWRLSIRAEDSLNGSGPYRRMTIDGKNIDFSDGFTDLHTASYREILAGRGFGIKDAEPALRLVNELQGRK